MDPANHLQLMVMSLRAAIQRTIVFKSSPLLLMPMFLLLLTDLLKSKVAVNHQALKVILREMCNRRELVVTPYVASHLLLMLHHRT